MKLLALAALGGAFGASGRYLVGVFALRTFGLGFPYGTFLVNVLGAIIMGLFIHMLATKFNGSAELRTFFATGVLGGFTTFSAFSAETWLLAVHSWLLAIGYIVVTVVACLLATGAGIQLMRVVT